MLMDGCKGLSNLDWDGVTGVLKVELVEDEDNELGA